MYTLRENLPKGVTIDRLTGKPVRQPQIVYQTEPAGSLFTYSRPIEEKDDPNSYNSYFFNRDVSPKVYVGRPFTSHLPEYTRFQPEQVGPVQRPDILSQIPPSIPGVPPSMDDPFRHLRIHQQEPRPSRLELIIQNGLRGIQQGQLSLSKIVESYQKAQTEEEKAANTVVLTTALDDEKAQEELKTHIDLINELIGGELSRTSLFGPDVKYLYGGRDPPVGVKALHIGTPGIYGASLLLASLRVYRDMGDIESLHRPFIGSSGEPVVGNTMKDSLNRGRLLDLDTMEIVDRRDVEAAAVLAALPEVAPSPQPESTNEEEEKQQLDEE